MVMSPAARMPAQSLRATSLAHTRRTDDAAVLSQPASMATRHFDIAALRRDGSRHIGQVRVPATLPFEQAFSAFARGTLLQTPYGEIAVEDLQPGDRLWTSAGGPAQVMWIGSGSFAPSTNSANRTPMFRIMSDTFGPGKPTNFLTLGPAARILRTPPHLRSMTGSDPLLTPIQEFVDGESIIEVVPPTAFSLFHIVLERHAAIRANGLECETFHPGSQSLRMTSQTMRDHFLSLFPHIQDVSDFGPLAHSRAPDHDPLLSTAGLAPAR